MSPKRDARRGPRTHRVGRGHSEVFGRSVAVCIGALASFCRQGPFHLSLLSPVLGLGP